MRHDPITPPLAQDAEAAGRNDVATDHMTLTLLRYRVTHFRSVKDSGWLDLGKITALVGVNESGKTNLLLPLWKLNPVADGALDPVSDYPKSLFAEIRAAPGTYRFIRAEFDTGPLADDIAALARIPAQAARRVAVGRLYDGSFTVEFPDHDRQWQGDAGRVRTRIAAARTRLEGADAPDSQVDLRDTALRTLEIMLAEIESEPALTGTTMLRLRNRVGALIPEDPPAVSEIVAELRTLRHDLGSWMAEILAPDPGRIDEVRRAVLSRLPRFVYYSSWGNLDSEIYLPHLVENMARDDLGAKELAKARTLRMLFDFVGLEPTEILELGRDFRDIREEATRRLADEMARRGWMQRLSHRLRGVEPALDPQLMAGIAEAKRTRSILLQSAGMRLGDRFGAWWRVRDCRFRFEADGNHFRIWVSDSERPQEVELEERSTGLQWFLSFFLVFLHESAGLHRNAVLLLDEPGLSLHPLAQRDLSSFFDEIAKTHQIVYTAHSPFLVDADRLDRARKVFVDKDGSTAVTSDLCAPERGGGEGGAAYAVRSAVNMAVAEASFGGADAVLVPGVVEQIYLSVVKTLLVAAGEFTPARDILFATAGNADVARRMAEILTGRRDRPPMVLRDDAFAGRAGGAGGTIEDLMPAEALARIVDRLERRPETMLSDTLRQGAPFVTQVEGWADAAGVTLHPDWRLDLSRRMRDHLLVRGPGAVPSEMRGRWRDVMRTCLGVDGAAGEPRTG